MYVNQQNPLQVNDLQMQLNFTSGLSASLHVSCILIFYCQNDGICLELITLSLKVFIT